MQVDAENHPPGNLTENTPLIEDYEFPDQSGRWDALSLPSGDENDGGVFSLYQL